MATPANQDGLIRIGLDLAGVATPTEAKWTDYKIFLAGHGEGGPFVPPAVAGVATPANQNTI